MTTALYLAHLNPVTNAHVEIIKELQSKSDKVIVMPVIFLKENTEVNSKSFPFSFEVRQEMLHSVFGDAVEISRNYTFYAPFSKYLPPLIAPKSWRLRRQILDGIENDYFTYTGDKIEGYMLRLYGLHPKVGRRRAVSASDVKSKMYAAASRQDTDWEKDVPEQVVHIIEENWHIVEKFAKIEDQTTRVVGMKFPKEGYR